MNRKIGVMDGVRATLGYELGLLIVKGIKGFLKFIRFCLALYIMFYIGDAIKTDQSKRGNNSNAVVHSINK